MTPAAPTLDPDKNTELPMTRPKGLGRGLDALLAGTRRAPRRRTRCRRWRSTGCSPASTSRARGWTTRRSHELAASIREQGVMQPILVRPVDGGRFEIIAGERRWRAAQRAGSREVPALVKRCPTSRRWRSR